METGFYDLGPECERQQGTKPKNQDTEVHVPTQLLTGYAGTAKP